MTKNKKEKENETTSEKEKETASMNHSNGDLEVDRLSNLPYVIIHHIMSFLDTKFIVQTSVLSKQWRYFWVSLPFLNFDPKHFSSPRSFEGFMNHVLSRRDSSIDVPHCELGYNYYSPRILNAVVKYVASHGIQHLTMDGFELELLPCLSASPSLTTLKLKRVATALKTLPAEYLNFAALTSLKIDSCSFTGMSIKNVNLSPFTGCPNLKDLQLHHCMLYLNGCWRSYNSFEISAPHLTSLTISKIGYNYLNNSKLEFVLSTPELQVINLKFKYWLHNFSMKDLPLLEKVDIDLTCFNTLEAIHLNKLNNILKGLRNAKFVTLSFSSQEVLSMISDAFSCLPSPFKRLEILKLKVPEKSFILPQPFFDYLVGGSPSAKVITIDLGNHQGQA